jgi:hypothetical protein
MNGVRIEGRRGWFFFGYGDNDDDDQDSSAVLQAGAGEGAGWGRRMMMMATVLYIRRKVGRTAGRSESARVSCTYGVTERRLSIPQSSRVDTNCRYVWWWLAESQRPKDPGYLPTAPECPSGLANECRRLRCFCGEGHRMEKARDGEGFSKR